MAIGGTRDGDTAYQWGTEPTYQHAASPRRIRIALNEAGHMVSPTPAPPNGVLTIVPNEFCSDPSWDRGRAHTLVAHFTAAFLLAELVGDATAAAALDPGRVELTDASYTAHGYEL